MEHPSVDNERLVALRHASVKGVCERLHLDAIVATQHDHVQYISDVRRFFVYGWEPNSLAIISREGEVAAFHCSDHVAPGPHWEGEELARETGLEHFTVFNSSLIPEWYADWVAKTLARLGVRRGRVGVDRVSWIILNAFRAATPGIEWVNAEHELLLARALKNEEEQKLLRYAGWVASEGVIAGLDAIGLGVREYEVAQAFMGRLYGLGSEGDCFYPFLTSGPVSQGALYPTNRALEEGDPVIIDMGPMIGGYGGDCMRTGFVGEPTPEFTELYRVNYESMYAGIEQIRPGVRISEVDAAVRRAAVKHGYLENRFDTGHGLGLNACELPVCMKAGVAPAHLDLVLEPGMCFTLEPRYFKMLDDGRYIQAALEETVLVTDDGVDVITPAPYLDLVKQGV